MPKTFKDGNFVDLSSVPTRHYEPFMLDGGSMKSEDKSILLCECQFGNIKWVSSWP